MKGRQPSQSFGIDRHHLLPVSRGFYLLWLLNLWRVVGSVEQRILLVEEADEHEAHGKHNRDEEHASDNVRVADATAVSQT